MEWPDLSSYSRVGDAAKLWCPQSVTKTDN